MNNATRIILILFIPLFFGCPQQKPRKFVVDANRNRQLFWLDTSVKSSLIVRGDGIPTIVVGRATSPDIAELANGELPFVFLLANAPCRDWRRNPEWRFDAQAEFIWNETHSRRLGQTSKTEIHRTGHSWFVRYDLPLEDGPCPGYAGEKLFINEAEFDLSHGRLFYVDINGDLSQRMLDFRPNSILPNKPIGGIVEFKNMLDWLDHVYELYPDIEG